MAWNKQTPCLHVFSFFHLFGVGCRRQLLLLRKAVPGDIGPSIIRLQEALYSNFIDTSTIFQFYDQYQPFQSLSHGVFDVKEKTTLKIWQLIWIRSSWRIITAGWRDLKHTKFYILFCIYVLKIILKSDVIFNNST